MKIQNPNEFIKRTGRNRWKNTDVKWKILLRYLKQYDKNVFVEEIHNGEFDYLIRFSEENEDPYYYCFHDEGCHIIYHRFYQKIMKISDFKQCY